MALNLLVVHLKIPTGAALLVGFGLPACPEPDLRVNSAS